MTGKVWDKGFVLIADSKKTIDTILFVVNSHINS